MTALRPGLVRGATPLGDYNAHYARDLGSFLLPLGGFLIVAAWRPSRSRLLLGFAAVASGFHAVSHLIEGFGSWKAFIALVFFVLVTILLGWSALAASQGR